MLTIVMYHYVRDLPKTRFPDIKGLLTERFEGQLDYITRHYTVCSFAEVIAATRGEDHLPPNPCLLTFDDGLADHYLTVFPRLEERGIVGSFYPPVRSIEEGKVLDVHKLHFILATMRDHQKLVDDLLGLIQRYRGEYTIPDDADLWKLHASPDRYNPRNTMFVKGLLQRGLPKKVRSEIVSQLFSHWVSEDEQAFAAELYMDLAQLRCMARHGMEIGGHGYDHYWLATLNREEQKQEVDRTIGFLSKIHGHRPSPWIMSYPYGSYNDETLELVKDTGCAIGLTTHPGLVTDLSKPLELNRLDTNDLPVSGDAAVSEWTRRRCEVSSLMVGQAVAQ